MIQSWGLLPMHVAQGLNRTTCVLLVIKYINFYPYILAGRSTRRYMGRFGSFMNKLTCGLGHGIVSIFTRNQQHVYDDIQTHHSDCDDSKNQSIVPLMRQHGVPFDSSELPFNSTSDEDMSDFFRDDIHAETVGHIPFMESLSAVDHPRYHSPVSISGYSGLRSTYSGSRSSSSGYSGSRSSSSGHSTLYSSSSGYSALRSSPSGYSAPRSSSSGYSGSRSSSSGYSGSRSSSSGYSGSRSSSSGYSGSRSFSSGYSGLRSSSSGYSGLHSLSSVHSLQAMYLNPSSYPFPSITDDVIQTVLSCLLHTSNCQIPNCPCKLVQLRYRELLQKQDTLGINIYPRECKSQPRVTLSSQNLNSEAYPHYHLTSRKSQVTIPLLQRKRSKSCDLTPVPQAATAGYPEEKQFYHDPAYKGCKPPLLFRKKSISAGSIPALCLNDCPFTPTPVREGQSLAFSPMRLRSRRWSMPKTDITTVREISQSTSSLETAESNTSSQSSGYRREESGYDSKPESTRWAHRWEQSESEHTNNGHSNPITVILSRKALEHRRTEIHLNSYTTITETLV